MSVTLGDDYFGNHGLKLRFPWRLYHGPIIDALQAAVGAERVDVLNFGSGPFIEARELKLTSQRITLCDIDERAMAQARELRHPNVVATDTLAPGRPLPYGDEAFDVVVSMDVIEHLTEPRGWLAEARRVLRPGGQLFLTTPNYGVLSTLPLIEATALELIARLQGFTRKNLHPTRFSAASLRRMLGETGFEASSVRRISMGWVLAASARRPGRVGP